MIGLIVSIFVPVQILYATEVTDVNGSRYYVDETLDENELPYGVMHYTDIAFTSAAPGTCTSAAAGSGGGGACIADQYYPQQVNVLEVPSSTEVMVVPWSRMSSAVWNLASVRHMISDFETRNPDYRVVAAINGDFYDINANKLFPRTPSGAHVALGEYYKTITGRTIGFPNDGSENSIIGNVTATRTSRPTLSIYDSEGKITHEYVIDNVNQEPGEGEVSLLYGNWALETGWSAQRIVPIDVEDAYLVEGADYALPIASNDFYGLGNITGYGDAEIGTAAFAIKSNNETISNLLDTGVRIRAQYGFTGAFENIDYAIGAGQTILFDGELQGSDTNRHPRTMIGRKDDGTIVMTVVDGRQPSTDMYGATQQEMAAILKHYGCVDGYNLDGGGSSTMIILDDGELVVTNSPSDGWERSNANGILVAVRVPRIDYSISDVDPYGFVVNAEVIDHNLIEFDDLFVEVNGVMKKVENGKVAFDGLDVFTDYSYAFYGKKGDDLFELVIEDRTNTGKRMPTLDLVSAFTSEEFFVVDVSISDLDSALVRRAIQIGDETVTIVNNRAIFEHIGGDFYGDMTVNLAYDLQDGKGRIDIAIDDYLLDIKLALYMDIVRSKLQQSISKVYG